MHTAHKKSLGESLGDTDGESDGDTLGATLGDDEEDVLATEPPSYLQWNSDWINRQFVVDDQVCAYFDSFGWVEGSVTTAGIVKFDVRYSAPHGTHGEFQPTEVSHFFNWENYYGSGGDQETWCFRRLVDKTVMGRGSRHKTKQTRFVSD